MDPKNEIPEGIVIPQRLRSCDPEQQQLQRRRREQIENNGVHSETLDRKWYNVKSRTSVTPEAPPPRKKQIPPFSLSSTLGYRNF